MEEYVDDLMILRDVLARELQTINTYQSQAAQAKRPEVKNFLQHILEEEKEHVAEAIEMIKELDANQARLMDRGGHWKPEGGPAQRPTPQIASQHESPNLLKINAFTVGSLRPSDS